MCVSERERGAEADRESVSFWPTLLAIFPVKQVWEGAQRHPKPPESRALLKWCYHVALASPPSVSLTHSLSPFIPHPLLRFSPSSRVKISSELTHWGSVTAVRDDLCWRVLVVSCNYFMIWSERGKRITPGPSNPTVCTFVDVVPAPELLNLQRRDPARGRHCPLMSTVPAKPHYLDLGYALANLSAEANGVISAAWEFCFVIEAQIRWLTHVSPCMI